MTIKKTLSAFAMAIVAVMMALLPQRAMAATHYDAGYANASATYTSTGMTVTVNELRIYNYQGSGNSYFSSNPKVVVTVGGATNTFYLNSLYTIVNSDEKPFKTSNDGNGNFKNSTTLTQTQNNITVKAYFKNHRFETTVSGTNNGGGSSKWCTASLVMEIDTKSAATITLEAKWKDHSDGVNNDSENVNWNFGTFRHTCNSNSFIKDDAHLAQAATCREEALYYRSCSYCGAIQSGTFQGDLAKHVVNPSTITVFWDTSTYDKPSCDLSVICSSCMKGVDFETSSLTITSASCEPPGCTTPGKRVWNISGTVSSDVCYYDSVAINRSSEEYTTPALGHKCTDTGIEYDWSKNGALSSLAECVIKLKCSTCGTIVDTHTPTPTVISYTPTTCTTDGAISFKVTDRFEEYDLDCYAESHVFKELHRGHQNISPKVDSLKVSVPTYRAGTGYHDVCEVCGQVDAVTKTYGESRLWPFGDVDGSGTLDAGDFSELADALSGRVELPLARADVNGDGKADVDDLKALEGVILTTYHESVDLGLPSGTIWATMNIGATSYEDDGDYFAWGETRAKNPSRFTSPDYKFGIDYTKYNVADQKTTLDLEDDAAYVNWGPDWCMPTAEQFDELMAYAVYGAEVDNLGSKPVVNLLTSARLASQGYLAYPDNYRNGKKTDGHRYWTNSLSADKNAAVARDWNLVADTVKSANRFVGCPIRPVRRFVAQSIAFDSPSMIMEAGYRLPLTVNFTPSNTTNKSLSWTTSDQRVATVLSNGTLVALNPGRATITATTNDGNNLTATCEVVVSKDESGTAAGHDYVDLNLPSGTLWATTNLGAESTEAYGNRYAWGETEAKKEFRDTNYKFYADGDFTKYNTRELWGTVDDLSILQAEDDAASQAWGLQWRTPSKEQQMELLDTTYVRITRMKQNDIECVRVTSRINGNSIILPLSGGGYLDRDTYSGYGEYGRYMSRQINPNDPTKLWVLEFHKSGYSLCTLYDRRDYGFSVRPVISERMKTLELNTDSVVIEKDAQTTLTATFTPTDVLVPTLIWQSTNESVATVTAEGVVAAHSEGTALIIVSSTDGSLLSDTCVVTVPRPTTGFVDSHKWIDLGLPSGTLWSAYNIGAEDEEDVGQYFAWGETTGVRFGSYNPDKTTFTWASYAHSGNTMTSLTKYCTHSDYGNVDGKTELDPEDDAAYVLYGPSWRTPTKEQFEELINPEYTTLQNTVGSSGGLRVTSRINGKSIYLPISSCFVETSLISNYKCYYWTRELYTTNLPQSASILYVTSSNASIIDQDRYKGVPIRPVYNPRQQ